MTSDLVSQDHDAPRCAFDPALIITTPLITPITAPTTNPVAMYSNRCVPDTLESKPTHQPPKDPKMLPMNPKPTIDPTEKGFGITSSTSSSDSTLGTSS